MTRRRTPRQVQADERALWDSVAAKATPMRPEDAQALLSKTAAELDVPAVAPPPPDPSVPPAKIAPFEVGAKRASQAGASITYVPPQGDSRLNMDRKAFLKMKGGKLIPEARLDLHGMTLAQAHPTLIGFITDAYAQGMRLVLVITGKGKDRDTGGPIPTRRGVLRHQVPDWLRMAPISPLVLQVSEANRKHGGQGALYVYLRRAR